MMRLITDRGVGHEVEAFPAVGRAEVGRTKHVPRRIEPERGQVGEHPSEGVSVINESCDVLHDDVTGSYCAHDVRHPGPAPSGVGGSVAEAGGREGLAGEAAADDVDSRALLTEPPVGGCSDVVMAWYLRPVSGQHGLAVGVDLHLTNGGHPGSF
jgi:hypothetical protein